MRRALAILVVLASSLSLAQAAPPATAPKAGDVVNNPPYAHWSQFKAGATVTVKEVVTLPDGSAGEAVITSKLLSKSKDKVQVETLVKAGGAKSWSAAIENTRTVTDYPASVRFEQSQTPTSAGYAVTEGKERLTVKGKPVDVEWVEATTTNGDEIVVEKVWTAREVPGGIVKQTVTKKKGGQTVLATTELVDYSAKLETKGAQH